MAVAAILLAGFRALFLALSPAIIAAKPTVSPTLVTPWVISSINEHDGIETPVAFAMFGCYLALVAVCAAFATRLRWRNWFWVLIAAGLWCAGFIVMHTQSSEFFMPKEASVRWQAFAVVLVGVIALNVSITLAHAKMHAAAKIGLALVVAACVAGFIIVSAPHVQMSDWGYYMGPALKHIRGEALGSFYMQYNLGVTLLFEAMMALSLRIHQMTLVMTVCLFLWYIIYWRLATTLFRSRALAWTCLLALFVVRFLNIRDHPAFVPQVMPLRLDMWVFTVLAVHRWGLRSPKTALVIALHYVADSTWGFICGGLYAALVLGSVLFDEKRRVPWRELAPIVAVAIWTRLVFGKFFAPSAAAYLDLQLGFMPIVHDSLFFPVILMLASAVAVFALGWRARDNQMGLLVCVLAFVHLIYFFGRSHDHNLLNVSAAWVFAFFLAIDHSSLRWRAQVGVAALFISVFAVMGAEQTMLKWDRVVDRVHRDALIEEHAVDDRVEQYRPIAHTTVVLLEWGDPYFNYRLDLPMRGYYSPFEAMLMKKDFMSYLEDAMRENIPIVTRELMIARWVAWAAQTSPEYKLQVAQRQAAGPMTGPIYHVVRSQ